VAGGGYTEHMTSSNVLLLHCIVGPYVCYIMFHLNVGVGDDDGV